jgi:para-nitrobenzyl esterase
MYFRKQNMLQYGGWLVLMIYLAFSFKTNPKSDRQETPFETVKIESGSISGTKSVNGEVSIFKGVPFAAPPIGDLRWKAPQPVKAWTGIKTCTSFGPSAMQGKPIPFGVYTSEFLIPDTVVSEDCLYINVWTAAKTASEKRPVLVWIYGGGFVNGSGSVGLYDGEAMAKKGVVFITFNYRLGIFGFFSHPDLTAESPNHASGNYGLLDQIAALNWVRRNIKAFGGDPENVTIDGQSAGSMSINCLMASPVAKGLFRHAIGESGAMFVPNPYTGFVSLKEDEADGLKMAQALNAKSLSELRAIPASQLRAKAKAFGYRPIIDGYVLPESIEEIFKAGKQNDADLMTGWNADDGLLLGPPRNAPAYKKMIALQFGADSGKFLQLYPGSTDSEATASQKSFSRDMIFGVQNYTWANQEATTGKGRVYLYHFTRKPPATGEFVRYGAFHSAEIVYALDNLFSLHRPWEDVDRKLASTMSALWVNFIRTGDPNGPGLPNWPTYQPSTKMEMLLSEQPVARPLPNGPALDFLEVALRKK